MWFKRPSVPHRTAPRSGPPRKLGSVLLASSIGARRQPRATRGGRFAAQAVAMGYVKVVKTSSYYSRYQVCYTPWMRILGCKCALGTG